MHIPGAPIIYDSLDRKNADTPDTPTRSPPGKGDYRIVVALLLFAGFFLLIVMLTHSYAVSLLDSYNPFLVAVGHIVLIGIYGTFLLVLASIPYALYHLVRTVSKKQQLVNVLEYQTTIERLTRETVIAPFLAVAKERARQSMYSNVSTLTQSNVVHEIQADAVQEEADEERAAPAIIQSSLLEMQRTGLINRSGHSLLLGFTQE
jgi:hypothetical protein